MSRSSVLERTIAATTVVIAGCAVILTATLLREKWRREGPTPPAAQRSEIIASWERFARSGHRRGAHGAPVTIVEFADFQCPFCREFALTLDSVRAKHPNQIAVVFRHLPLQRIHPFALQTARAALCANKQDRFWEFHDAVFRRQNEIGLGSWESYANESGIKDVNEFATCLGERWQDRVLASDSADAAVLGVMGTPTILVNETLIRGAPSVEKLDRLVVAALARR